ncbi:MAG: hypothetical protein IPI73_30305 [Betaproteobacteria bacterium]|nr:hypothetical protein [Betaproteobacteria bacterium]
MSYIDFAALKASVRIEQVVALLGLQMQEKNQLRGICPACKSNGDRDLVVTPSKNAFYCFGSRAGGDLITLAAHIKRHLTQGRSGIHSGRSAGNRTS